MGSSYRLALPVRVIEFNREAYNRLGRKKKGSREIPNDFPFIIYYHRLRPDSSTARPHPYSPDLTNAKNYDKTWLTLARVAVTHTSLCRMRLWL